MSETGPLLTVAHLQSSDLSGDPGHEVQIRTKAGRACPLVDLRIVDPDMKDTPRNGATSGEVVVRAPWLTNGYFDNPEASEQLWAGKYLHTSDIGVMDPDGYLQITDRIKDVIKTGGEWISSLQLEDIIMHRAGVAECAVIGVKDARWGERPLALIVRDPKSAMPVTAEEIRAHVLASSEKGVISKFAVPEKILFVDALAKTSVGKFDKKSLRALYGDAA
jgi:fatty-acyl-CoA synthase